MKSNLVMAAGSTIQIQLLDETGFAISFINATGAGVNTIATVSNIINDAQSVDNPTSPASDYTLTITRTLGVATINNSHVVLYYT